MTNHNKLRLTLAVFWLSMGVICFLLVACCVPAPKIGVGIRWWGFSPEEVDMYGPLVEELAEKEFKKNK